MKVTMNQMCVGMCVLCLSLFAGSVFHTNHAEAAKRNWSVRTHIKNFVNKAKDFLVMKDVTTFREPTAAEQTEYREKNKDRLQNDAETQFMNSFPENVVGDKALYEKYGLVRLSGGELAYYWPTNRNSDVLPWDALTDKERASVANRKNRMTYQQTYTEGFVKEEVFLLYEIPETKKGVSLLKVTGLALAGVVIGGTTFYLKHSSDTNQWNPTKWWKKADSLSPSTDSTTVS